MFYYGKVRNHLIIRTKCPKLWPKIPTVNLDLISWRTILKLESKVTEFSSPKSCNLSPVRNECHGTWKQFLGTLWRWELRRRRPWTGGRSPPRPESFTRWRTGLPDANSGTNATKHFCHTWQFRKLRRNIFVLYLNLANQFERFHSKFRTCVCFG